MKKADKEILKTVFETVWGNDESMIKSEIKYASGYCVLDNDMCVVFSKPTIKTDFCFGYSMYDGRTEESAYDASRNARTDPEYFLSRNKENMMRKADKYVAYRKYGEGNACSYIALDKYEEMRRRGCEPRTEPYFLSDAECERLNVAIDKANADFEKRLNAYLKKYGLSKIKSWTYWADE